MLFPLSTGNTFNHEHLSHVAQFLSGIFIYLIEKAKLPHWVCIFRPFPSLRKKNPHFMVSKELPHSLFSILFWVQVSESVPMSLSGFAVVLYNKSYLLESSPKKTVLRLGHLFPECAILVFLQRVQVVETLFKAKYHLRAEFVKSHTLVFWFFSLLTV